MSLKVKELIKILKTKNQNQDVQFVVSGTSGNLVCMQLESKNALHMVRVLELFTSGKAD